MVSMQDIADRVGISKATVSLVLNGKAGSRVSAATQKKVLEAAAELDYHINNVARSLRMGQSPFVGIVVTDISNEFFGKLTFHIQEEAKKHGFMVITVNTNESSSEFDDIVSMLISNQVAGIIAVPTNDSLATLSRIRMLGIPLVQIDRTVEGIDADYVGVDNYVGTRNAMRKLLAKGKRRCAMVSFDLDVNPIIDRQKGFKDALAEAGVLDPSLIKIIHYENQETGIPEAIEELSAAHPDLVFFSSRRAFTQSMAYLSTHHRRVPEATLLCFDNVESYRAVAPDIWFIDQPVKEMAEKSFQLLLERIKGRRETETAIFSPVCNSPE